MDKQEVPVPVADKTEGNSGKQSFGLPKKWVYVLVAVVLLGVALLIGFILGNRTATAPEVSTKAAKQDKMVPPAEPKDQKPEATFSCASGKTAFQDKDFGARFCYPASWGTASLADAKVAPSDTGNRQQISFAANPLVSVGGVSEDWSTTVGRGVGCLEPQKDAPPLSSYNTEWHNMSGSGMAVDFAERSLPSKKGGYSITETVSSMLVEGVCVHGYKQVNGSPYKVVSAAFYRSFPEASGITTPSAHMAEPNILFSTEQRDDFDALLASLEAY